MKGCLTTEYSSTGLALRSGKNEQVAETALMGCCAAWQQQISGVPVKNLARKGCSLNNLSGDTDINNCQPADGWSAVHIMAWLSKSIGNSKIGLYTVT